MIAAIIQARMGSSRLPNKVMMDLCGKPVLWHVINRVKNATHIDYLIVATTRETSDNIIEQQCKLWDVPVFRGPVDDVLTRFFQAVQYLESMAGPVNMIVRITADCPLIDPHIINSVVNDMVSGDYDYVSNIDPPTYPDGFDVEIFTRAALDEVYHNATLASEREHVTPAIRNNPRFKKFNHRNIADLSNIRLTLDTGKDFLLISQIYQTLYRHGEIFFLDDVMTLLKMEPALREINVEYERNEGYRKSLEHDHTR